MYLGVSRQCPRFNLRLGNQKLTSGRPANIRSPHVRHIPTAKEDAAHQNHADVVPEVEASFPLLFSFMPSKVPYAPGPSLCSYLFPYFFPHPGHCLYNHARGYWHIRKRSVNVYRKIADLVRESSLAKQEKRTPLAFPASPCLQLYSVRLRHCPRGHNTSSASPNSSPLFMSSRGCAALYRERPNQRPTWGSFPQLPD